MTDFISGCRFNPTAGGTSDWTFSSAVSGYSSPALAGAVNGRPYTFRAESGDLSQWEDCAGNYSSSGAGSFPRTTVLFNSSGTGTGPGQSGAGTKINFTTTPQVAIIALAEDLPSLSKASNAFTGDMTVGGTLGVTGSVTSSSFVDAASATGYRLGGTAILTRDATYTYVNNPSGATRLFFGNAGDPANYFDNTTHYFRSAAAAFQIHINSSGIAPTTDNVFLCGGPSNRFATVYAVTGTINTSDATEKRLRGSGDLSPYSVSDDVFFEAVLAVPQDFFQWLESIERKGDDGARWHYGPTAQAVRDTFIKYGIDPLRLALFCVDPIMENEFYDDIDEESGRVINKVRQVDTGKVRLGLRLDQFDRLRTEAVRRLIVVR